VLWALGQPAAAVGLASGFVLGLGVRAAAHRTAGWLLGVGPMAKRLDVDPIGAVAALLSGTGWGAGFSPSPVLRLRAALAVAIGPLAVLVASQGALLAFTAGYPDQRGALLLNRPSDVLHGALASTMPAQFVLSTAGGLLCFGLLALLPLPPLDGLRLIRLMFTELDAAPRPTIERVGAVLVLVFAAVPLPSGLPPLLHVLDLLGTPILRAWT
jgi:hypothetical protein